MGGLTTYYVIGVILKSEDEGNIMQFADQVTHVPQLGPSSSGTDFKMSRGQI